MSIIQQQMILDALVLDQWLKVKSHLSKMLKRLLILSETDTVRKRKLDIVLMFKDLKLI